jgi:tRNA(Arg) A34 adenosine deaminase TadA
MSNFQAYQLQAGARSPLLLLVAKLTYADSSCLQPGDISGPYDEWGFPADTPLRENNPIKNSREELDLIYSLLTYAVVYKTWQTDLGNHSPIRGHNYGAVLVDPMNEIAHWGRNEVYSTGDDTQHAETRAIQQYLRKTKVPSLKGYTIYVGGDSCPMCAGMISQQQISRVVLGLSNPLFGKNFDRMNLNSRKCGKGTIQGLSSVARKVKPIMSTSAIRKQLDMAFRKLVIESCESSDLEGCKKFPSQTDFLKSPTAFVLFEKASKEFAEYKLRFPNEKAAGSLRTNGQLYEDALNFLKNRVNITH